MTYYITRFTFLFFIACTLLGTAYTLVNMGFGNSGGAMKSLFLTVCSLFLAMLARWECSEETLPELPPFRYEYRAK